MESVAALDSAFETLLREPVALATDTLMSRSNWWHSTAVRLLLATLLTLNQRQQPRFQRAEENLLGDIGRVRRRN